MKAISQAGHFLFSGFLWLAGWRWSSLISPEPTGLFFHLHIPSSYCQPRALFHIFFLFKSLTASLRRAVSLSFPCLYAPAAEKWNLSERQSLTPSPPLPPVSSLPNNTFLFFVFFSSLQNSADPHKTIILWGSQWVFVSGQIPLDGPIIEYMMRRLVLNSILTRQDNESYY